MNEMYQEKEKGRYVVSGDLALSMKCHRICYASLAAGRGHDPILAELWVEVVCSGIASTGSGCSSPDLLPAGWMWMWSAILDKGRPPDGETTSLIRRACHIIPGLLMPKLSNEREISVYHHKSLLLRD